MDGAGCDGVVGCDDTCCARTGMLESIPASSDMAMSQRPGGIVIG